MRAPSACSTARPSWTTSPRILASARSAPKSTTAGDYEYIYVNNEPVFLSGLLDQGFWEEGVYTAPSEEALKYDIKAMRDRGFNMIRKHLKIEDPLQYYWADRLGMFVWQDMPHATYMNAKSNGGETPGRAVYEYALENMLNRDYNHPSVIAVMLFNETWGIDHNGQKASDGMTTTNGSSICTIRPKRSTRTCWWKI